MIIVLTLGISVIIVILVVYVLYARLSSGGQKNQADNNDVTVSSHNENDHAKKEILIKELFGSTGEHPFVNPNFRCEFGQNIHDSSSKLVPITKTVSGSISG